MTQPIELSQAEIERLIPAAIEEVMGLINGPGVTHDALRKRWLENFEHKVARLNKLLALWAEAEMETRG